MVNAVDLATKLNSTTAANLYKSGVRFVGRYLPTQAWKGLTTDEINAIKGVGLDLWSIFEHGGTYAGYFTAGQAAADATMAHDMAKALGQPAGTAIYFAVDYDAKAADLPAINAYFQVLKAKLQDYKLGIYGKNDVLVYVNGHCGVDFYWQTYAWSGGNRINFKHIYQFQNDTKLAGLAVDFVNIEITNFGAWGQVEKVTVEEVQNSEYVGKTLTSKVDGLWFYNTPKWSSCDGTSNKGDSWIITKEFTCNGGRMLQCHDGKYRTASPDYVDVSPKPSDWPYSVQIDGINFQQAQEIVILIGQNYKNAKAQGIAK